MGITKADAIVWIANRAGMSDGDFTEEEVTDALQKTSYMTYLQDALAGGVHSKISNGELTEDSAISILKELPREEQIEAMAICLAIVKADGEMTDDETDFLFALLAKIGDFDFTEVFAKYAEMTS